MVLGPVVGQIVLLALPLLIHGRLVHQLLQIVVCRALRVHLFLGAREQFVHRRIGQRFAATFAQVGKGRAGGDLLPLVVRSAIRLVHECHRL